MGFVPRIGTRVLVYAKINTRSGLRIQTHISETSESIHTTATKEPKIEEIINPICDLLRRGGNWDLLSSRFHSIRLTDSVVEKVLLELKEPTDAKKALNFFHWSRNRTNFEHGVRSYCITIHILVRARLLIDARALLESVIKKASEFGVSEMLVSTYKSTLSSPFVFDLLIQSYSKLRLFDKAFEACRLIEENGFSCSLISFNTLIHLVQKSDQISLVWRIYEFMIQKRTYPNEKTVQIMINALCKEGNLQRFIDILDRIHGKRCSPSVIVNTSLVFRILEEERIDEGITLLKRLLQKNMILDDVTYSLIIYGKIKIGEVESATKLFEEMLNRGFHANSFLYTLFIGAYCKKGMVNEANDLFEEMKKMGLKPYEETFNVLIEGHSDADRASESLNLCEEMIKDGLLPSRLSFNEMIREVREIKRANSILTVILDKGFVPDEITYCYLMDGYGKDGEIQEVLKLFYEIEYRLHSPGQMAYTSLIRSLCQCGKLQEAEKYLTVMEDRSIVPTSHIYETLILGYCKKGEISKAGQLYRHDQKGFEA